MLLTGNEQKGLGGVKAGTLNLIPSLFRIFLKGLLRGCLGKLVDEYGCGGSLGGYGDEVIALFVPFDVRHFFVGLDGGYGSHCDSTVGTDGCCSGLW